MDQDIKQYTSVYNASNNTDDEYIGIYSQNWYDDNDRIIKNPYYRKEEEEFSYENNISNKSEEIDRTKINSWMDFVPTTRIFNTTSNKTKKQLLKINIPNMTYKLKISKDEYIIIEEELPKKGFGYSKIKEKYIIISTNDNFNLYNSVNKKTFKKTKAILIDLEVLEYLCYTKYDYSIEDIEKSKYSLDEEEKCIFDKINNQEYIVPKKWNLAYKKNAKVYFVDKKSKEIKNIKTIDY